jgi:hypothetical protein
MVSFKPRSLHPREWALGTQWIGGQAPEPVWTLWSTEECLASTGNTIPAVQLVARCCIDCTFLKSKRIFHTACSNHWIHSEDTEIRQKTRRNIDPRLLILYNVIGLSVKLSLIHRYSIMISEIWGFHGGDWISLSSWMCSFVDYVLTFRKYLLFPPERSLAHNY